jgi:nucleotide-binding universal stress UspA family protein
VSSGHDAERPRIVVGVDGFEPSRAALRWAIDQAKLTGATVEAVTAWHVPAGTEGLLAADMPDYLQDARAVLAESVAECGTIDSDVETRCYVLAGRAGQVLVDAAEGADLLVVGCRGHGDPAETMLGSVGQFCAHYAPCPVVIMRGKH